MAHSSEEDFSYEPMTRLETFSGKFGTFDNTSDYNNDGTRTSTGFLHCTDDMYLLMSGKDPKVIKTRFGGLKKLSRDLKTDLRSGICGEPDLGHRVAAFGENKNPEPPHASWLELFLDALQDVALIILIVAALVALVAGLLEQFLVGDENEQEWIEGVAILVTVMIVAVVTATNDYTKDIQFRALKQSQSDRKVRVLRDGSEQFISIFNVVVGDIVRLFRGDQIPADGLLIPGLEELSVDESPLTGESRPQVKNEENPFLYSGCFVTKGSGEMLVVAVGPQTEWGRTLALVADEHPPTPLQVKLEDLVVLIGKVGIGVASVVFFVLLIYYIVASVHPHVIVECSDEINNLTCTKPYNLSNPGTCIPLCHNYTHVPGQPNHVYIPSKWRASSLLELLSSFIIAVTIVVVAVPEGLPLAVTISLAYSVKQMQKDNNLVRHLSACEVMGGATNICSDKTGTLTEGKMSVTETWIGGNPYHTSQELCTSKLPQSLETLLRDSLCLNNDDGELSRKDGKVEFLGNPTECALLVLAEKFGVDYKKLQVQYPPVRKWGFTSARKRMSTVVSKEGRYRLYCKGAAEIILDRCSAYLLNGNIELLYDGLRRKLRGQIEGYASQGLRALTLAYRDLESSFALEASKDGEGYEEDLVLVGIVAIEDKLRDEVPDSVRLCQRAGITVRMITGDNIITAKKIATDCFILTPEGSAMEGPDFEKLTDAEACKALETLQVLARSRPVDKFRLVTLLTQMGEVVAVTGDGTNDAPALSAADVGLAMGSGTEVAKDAADIIIIDDNFASIVKSVMWGRCIYDNIRKFLQFQLTVNIVALVVAFFGAVTGFGTPLTAVQLLWVNLIMDTMAALALGTEKPTKQLLLRHPYGRQGKLITPIMIRNILGQSVFQLVILFCILYAVDKNGNHKWFPGVPTGRELAEEGKPSVHYTILFNTFVLCQVFNEINSRRVDTNLNVFEGMLTNWLFVGIIAFTCIVQILIVQFGGLAIRTVPLEGVHWAYCVGIAFFSLPWGFLLRLIPVPLEEWEREDWDE
eukprot:TRINITY_DN7940_c0_g1_i1.p1 TRINITY_DN7940_c0_g1~~TRINITY_DN7940_c0_g1_i1.p1  ORF type:complete len:1036 (+),score=226.04 TRINITY_DN7940_c0_g1_i1:730-3837(+)